MRALLFRIALSAVGTLALTTAASAQSLPQSPVDGVTISAGGGVQWLVLPDVKFTRELTPNSFQRQKNNDFDAYGGSVGGFVETPLGLWGDYRVTGMIAGFGSNVSQDGRRDCGGGVCVAIDPNGDSAGFSSTLRTKSSRDVDYWGGAAELRFWSPHQVQVRPNLYRNNYFIIGAGARGIDQDTSLHGFDSARTDIFNYKETLDTTYWGGYLGLGGEYSLGFLTGGTGGIIDRLGLRSFISARAGLYSADTDYDGAFFLPATPASKLSLSHDDLAFIGSLSLETRKQIGPRSSLSLFTDYEYISSVPTMRYSDGASRTRFEEDSAFASRTMLRLNIGLGPSQLYPAQ
jgi:hypothetical protein